MTARLSYRGKKVKRITELGIEKLCPGCDEWWPQIPEFFTYISTRGHYHSECRACLASAQAQRRLKTRESA